MRPSDMALRAVASSRCLRGGWWAWWKATGPRWSPSAGSTRTSTRSTSPCRERRSWLPLRRSARSWCARASASSRVFAKAPGRRERPSWAHPWRAGAEWSGGPPADRLRAMRADWDTYFMEIATVVSSRSTCDRKHVGALLVRDRMILSTGYNGSIRGMPHCDDVGHVLENGHCVATIHAEANSILQAARNGVRIDGADIYTTASPCWPCFKLVANAGIQRVVYAEFYRDDRIFDVARRLGISLVDLSGGSAQPAEKLAT